MISLRTHPLVSDEVEAIAGRLAESRPKYGLGFLVALHSAYQSIQAAPTSFPKWGYPVRGYDIRFTVLRRFKHVVIFDVRESEVLIVSVYHQRRHHRHWLNRLRDHNA